MPCTMVSSIGAGLGPARPFQRRRRGAANTWAWLVWGLGLGFLTPAVLGQSPAPPAPGHPQSPSSTQPRSGGILAHRAEKAAPSENAPPKAAVAKATAVLDRAQTGPHAPPAPILHDARRFRIRDGSGQTVVARLHGQHEGKSVLMQPDGQLGYPSMLVPTEQPFEPMTIDALKAQLREGPYADYQDLTTRHYLIFYQSSFAFAQDSARLLEDLYQGLIEVCHKHGVPAHETEFPLVAVIFANERDFRAHKTVEPEVQAYYEIFTNRIFFYQKSDLDRQNPKVAYLRRPQTVAHEGAHQILANIGVQPRLSSWPLWLVEGFAEYCATPAHTKKGIAWDRLGTINALHMATLRELDDTMSQPLAMASAHRFDALSGRSRMSGRTHRLIHSEGLVRKERLTPTDYALSWALTHYLARKRGDDFVRYLMAMGRMPPLEPRTPEQHLAKFRKYFGKDLSRLDKEADKYIRALSNARGYDRLPYYAVIFMQPLGGGMVKRAAYVSQSPQMIHRWVGQMSAPQGGVPNWEAHPFPTKSRAVQAAEEWMRSNR